MSSQICSHTLAVAERNGELLKFLEWYVKLGQGPNLSSLALSGVPKGRGQKGGRKGQGPLLQFLTITLFDLAWSQSQLMPRVDL